MKKKCSMCNEEKEYSEYYKNKSKDDGLQSYCKPCYKKMNKKYYDKNKEHLYEQKKEYISKNRDKINAYYRKKYAENSEPFKVRHNKWENKNREYRINYHKEYRKNNQEICIRGRLLTRARNRAKEKGFDFDLDKTWLDEKLKATVCCKTGIPFIYEADSPYVPSIDRINSNMGYTKNNCRLVCKIYNFAKNMWTDDDVEIMATGLLK